MLKSTQSGAHCNVSLPWNTTSQCLTVPCIFEESLKQHAEAYTIGNMLQHICTMDTLLCVYLSLWVMAWVCVPFQLPLSAVFCTPPPENKRVHVKKHTLFFSLHRPVALASCLAEKDLHMAKAFWHWCITA